MRRRIRNLIACFAATSLAIMGLAMLATNANADGSSTRFVATTGSDATNTCLVSGSPCKTIGHAIAQAAGGDTIQLEPGTYLESDNPTGTANAIGTALDGLNVQSDPSGGTAANTIIDATGEANGLVVNANDVTIKDITVRGADLQGILVSPPSDATAPAAISGLRITGTTVTGNDLCSKHPGAADCPPPSPEDDYGEGIQLLSVVNSTVTHSTVTDNFGGILMTDELGPNHGNTISNNTVSNNFGDCGITMASHNGNAVATTGANTGHPQPTLGGVYSNTITNNIADGNGAAGIIMAGPFPGTAAYGNTVSGNTANENGLAGIAIHSHTPLQDMNGNVITGNSLMHDSISGNNGHPGDSDAGTTHTTGILVLSATSPLTGTVVTGNTITDNYYGVWISGRTPSANVSGNTITVVAGGFPILVHPAGPSNVGGMARTPSGHGYWEFDASGTVLPFGDANYYGSMSGAPLASQIVGMAPTASGHGYWLVGQDGGIFSFGDAAFHGSMGAVQLNQPIVGMAATSDGLGYWMVASDGGIFSFGTAKFEGSMGGVHLNQPVVGMAAAASGLGYWMVASDGGIFSFGTAKFHGSMGGAHLNQPVVGMAGAPGGLGYWMVAADGGIFSFGTAKFHGSMGAVPLNQPMIGMTPTTTGLGYWTVAADGGIFSFGDAHFYGSEPAEA